MKFSQPEFFLKRREKLLAYKYYSANFDFMQEALGIVEETLSLPEEELSASPPADLMHPTHERALMMTDFVSTCYSAGHEITYLRSLYPSLLEFWETYAQYSKAYNDSTYPPSEVAHIALSETGYYIALRLVSWAILFGQQALLARLPPLFDYNNPARDGLLEQLLARYQAAHEAPSAECTRHQPYLKALKIFAAPSELRSQLMAEYLEGWYAASRQEPYFDSHKRDSRFTGYWCWEAAAITITLDIDDSSYRDAKFYPADLVEFARKTGLRA